MSIENRLIRGDAPEDIARVCEIPLEKVVEVQTRLGLTKPAPKKKRAKRAK